MTAKRVCSKCGHKKPLDSEHFPRIIPSRHGNKSAGSGFRKLCLVCYNDKRRNRYATPPKPEKEKLGALQEHHLRRENRELRLKYEELAREIASSSEYTALLREVLAKQESVKPARIITRERKSGLLEGTPLVLASDWHVEERVAADKVAFRNVYNLEIAEQRMRRFFQAFRWAMKHQRDVFKIRDAILWLGGDFMTNFLHEDDLENNLLPPLEAVLFLKKHLQAGIDYLLEDKGIEQYIIPCNDGNHGRTTKKLRAATRPEHSLEVMLYALLAQHYENEPRLRFILPRSVFVFLDDVYGRTIRFLHGDAFNYGGGVGGITVPLFRALARWEKLRHADLTCMGHWHQRYNLPDVMVNGSLIGYNSFAMSKGFPFEPPVQSLRMLEPTRWCSIDIPLWVSSREDDINNLTRKAA